MKQIENKNVANSDYVKSHKRGRPSKGSEKRVKLQVYLPPEDAERMSELANSLGVKVDLLVCKAVNMYLQYIPNTKKHE